MEIYIYIYIYIYSCGQQSPIIVSGLYRNDDARTCSVTIDDPHFRKDLLYHKSHENNNNKQKKIKNYYRINGSVSGIENDFHI